MKTALKVLQVAWITILLIGAGYLLVMGLIGFTDFLGWTHFF